MNIDHTVLTALITASRGITSVLANSYSQFKIPNSSDQHLIQWKTLTAGLFVSLFFFFSKKGESARW